MQRWTTEARKENTSSELRQSEKVKINESEGVEVLSLRAASMGMCLGRRGGHSQMFLLPRPLEILIFLQIWNPSCARQSVPGLG